MGNQWGDIYLCVPPTKMLGGRVRVPPIIAAPGASSLPCTRMLFTSYSAGVRG